MAEENEVGLSGDLDILDTTSESEETTPEEVVEESVVEEEQITEEPTTEESEKEVEEEKSPDEEILDEKVSEDEDEAPMSERPLKGMKAKYPKVFKDFPALKQAWYSSREFYDVFPSVQAAKEAAERSATLAVVEKDIFRDGSAKELVTKVKSGNEESFKSFTGSFLETVRELDAEQYNSIVTPVFDSLINHIHSEGNRLNDATVKSAAQVVYNMIHPDGAPTNTPQQENKEQLKLDRDKKDFEVQKQQHFQGQYQMAQEKVLSRVTDAIKTNVTRSLNDLEVSGYLKENITSDVLNEVFSNLKQDGEFQSSQTSLWESAVKNQFSDDTLNQIANTALRRVSKVLPRIRGEVRSKALGGISRGSKETTRKGSTSKGGRKKITSPKDIREMSDLDVLSDDVVVS